MTEYMKIIERREEILKSACRLAEESHYTKIRRHDLAFVCSTAPGNISRVMGSMDELRTAMIEYALAYGIVTVVAQAILDKHPAVDHLNVVERRQYLSLIV